MASRQNSAEQLGSSERQTDSTTNVSQIGIVVIGRNEGPRLRECLASATPTRAPIVYVDSGSTDESVFVAREFGADVVELDGSSPFTAARGRNAGFARLDEGDRCIDFVQFVDGDCLLSVGWLDRAKECLTNCEDIDVVFGRRRERFPEASVYNQLADQEWNVRVGEQLSCGGDAMMRTTAFRRVKGYNPSLIAGEEAELCFRLRANGGRIVCVDAEMTLHDIAMTRFSEWWVRQVRAGHAYAENAWLYGRSRSRHRVRQVASSLAWGIALPLVAFVMVWPTGGVSLLLLLAYAFLFTKVRRDRRRRGDSPHRASVYAMFLPLGKVAQACGVFVFSWRRLLWRQSARLIEYKGTLETLTESKN